MTVAAGARGRAASVALVLLVAGVAACSPASATDPDGLASSITRAVYANDYAATVASFDEATKASVTRSDLGALSDRMHALGTLKDLTRRTGDPDTGRYTYQANFSGGALIVEVRVDPSGRVGAYRAVPAAN